MPDFDNFNFELIREKIINETATIDEKIKIINYLISNENNLITNEILTRLSSAKESIEVRSYILDKLDSFSNLTAMQVKNIIDNISKSTELEVQEKLTAYYLGITPYNLRPEIDKLPFTMTNFLSEKILDLKSINPTFENLSLPSYLGLIDKNTDKDNKEGYAIQPIDDVLSISNNLEMIVIFDLFPINKIDSLKNFLEDYKMKEVNEIYRIFDISKVFSSDYLDNAELHLLINSDNYIEMIFKIKIKMENLHNNTFKDIKTMKEFIDSLHIQIEEQIPNELYGLSLSNSQYRFRSPSLLIYNAQKYYHLLDNKDRTISSLEVFHCNTGRCKASSFLENFTVQNKDNENILKYLDIDTNFVFGFIDPVLIISCSSNCLYKYKKNLIFYSFGALSFSRIDDDRITNFILELSEIIHIYVIINKIYSDLEEIIIPTFENSQSKSHLDTKKIEQQKIKNEIDKYYDLFLKYEKLDVLDDIISERNLFFNEETYVTTAFTKDVRYEYSISNIFKDDIKKKIQLIKKDYQHKTQRISYNLNQINDQLSQFDNLPIVNSRFRKIASELITQIKKWNNIFEKRDIERWLSNFDDDEDRLLALKILDKIIYFSNTDLNDLCEQLYFRIQELNHENKNDFFIYSFIGKLTSGSLHVLNPFQQIN